MKEWIENKITLIFLSSPEGYARDELFFKSGYPVGRGCPWTMSNAPGLCLGYCLIDELSFDVVYLVSSERRLPKGGLDIYCPCP